jgi:hypothetical protein
MQGLPTYPGAIHTIIDPSKRSPDGLHALLHTVFGRDIDVQCDCAVAVVRGVRLAGVGRGRRGFEVDVAKGDTGRAFSGEGGARVSAYTAACTDALSLAFRCGLLHLEVGFDLAENEGRRKLTAADYQGISVQGHGCSGTGSGSSSLRYGSVMATVCCDAETMLSACNL